MITKFAILVGRTLVNVIEKNTSVVNLRVLLSNLNGRNRNKLTEELIGITDINEAFLALNQFWSFFEYDILSCIIEGFCIDLKPELDEYNSSLKEYCKRRVCEVPGGSVCSKEIEAEKILYIQVDKSFAAEIERIKMEELQDLESKLGLLLGTSFLYIEMIKGSIVIAFKCLHEFDVIFPLSAKQEEELQKIGVTRIYSKEQEYFRYSLPPSEEGLQLILVVASK